MSKSDNKTSDNKTGESRSTKTKAKGTDKPSKPAPAVASKGSTPPLPTGEQLLDESLEETFPASDPITASGESQARANAKAGGKPDAKAATTSKDKGNTPGKIASKADASAPDKAAKPEKAATPKKKAAKEVSTDPIHFPVTDDVHPGDSPEVREEKIRNAAYFRAEKRGFEHGYDEEDWLAAEIELYGQKM